MGFTERSSCAGHEALRLSHVRCAIHMNMHFEVRKAGDQVAGPTCMIKVYMCE